MLTIRAMTGGATYASHHLSNNDYYSVGETIEGQWMGRGAELLGLEGKVDLEQFEAIREGRHPDTGDFLRQRRGADRVVEREGQQAEVYKARNLYDFTISAPKAVSVQAMVDPRLVEAHEIAASETVIEMERLASTKVQRNGMSENRITSNLVIARYEHNASRELDPQLHTHFVAGNLTFDGPEGRWKALQPGNIYDEREYLTEVYRNALAREVAKRGYPIEDRFEHGKDLGFSLAGSKEATLEKYSRRSEQRDRAIAEFMADNGRRPTNSEIAYLVRETREDKLKEISSAEVKARQLARLDPDEARTLKESHQEAVRRGSVREQVPARSSLTYATEHLFERVSVAKEYELKTEALRHGRGRIELPELKNAIRSEITTGGFLSARDEVATKESLHREQRMVATINAGVKQFEPLGRSRRFQMSDSLRSEKKTALRTVLNSRDLAVNIAGAAGVGKTHLLQEVHRGLTESRRGVVVVAPTASAVEELQKVGFPNAMTVARLLSDPEQRQQAAGQVLIVDEAGMVSSKDMAALIDLARTKESRIIFSGDTRQIKSVAEGDALRVLERESNLKTVSLVQVQRQVTAEYKAAVEALRNQPADGFTKLQAMGAIREVDWLMKSREVSQIYREAGAVLNRKGKERSVLVVAATHDEIRSITHAIRQDRQQAGQLSKGEAFTQHVPLNWTEAQKRRLKNYQPGQVLEFHKPVKGFAKNEAVEVIRTDKTGITVRKADGREVTLTSKQSKAFGVFERQEIEISPGDKLLLQANRRAKDLRVTNGELVTVASVNDRRIQLEDGRQLPADYRQLAHGYAVTAHRSQGKSVDFQIVMADHMPRDLFYVSASRGREGIAVVTSDSQALQESIGVSADRQSASELARRATTQAEEFQRHRSETTRRERAVMREAPVKREEFVQQQVQVMPDLQKSVAHQKTVPTQQKEKTHERSVGIGF